MFDNKFEIHSMSSNISYTQEISNSFISVLLKLKKKQSFCQQESIKKTNEITFNVWN